jgi:hypothetical protein
MTLLIDVISTQPNVLSDLVEAIRQDLCDILGCKFEDDNEEGCECWFTFRTPSLLIDVKVLNDTYLEILTTRQYSGTSKRSGEQTTFRLVKEYQLPYTTSPEELKERILKEVKHMQDILKIDFHRSDDTLQVPLDTVANDI